MKVIGITGTIGAGKGAVVDYLVGSKGFKHFSVREYLVKEIQKRGMEVNRNSMVIVANDLRKTFSPSYLIEQLYKEAISSGYDCVIESIRTPGEVNSLRKVEHFILLAIDADRETRYKRIVCRGSETDNIDFNTFVENENREMNSDDENKQNIRKCIEMADLIIYNDGTLEELHSKIDSLIK